MSEQQPASPRYLRTDEAGHLLGLSGRTLEKYRSCGTGPVYRKIGGLVVYTAADLHAWADAGLRNSTSDPVTRDGRVKRRTWRRQSAGD